MKKILRKLSEKSGTVQYLSLILVCIVMFGFLSVPTFFEYEGNTKAVVRAGMYLYLFGIAFLYGLISAEITENLILPNVLFIIAGGFAGALFCGEFLQITYEAPFLQAFAMSCFHFVRYVPASLFVGIIVKNTSK